MHNKILNTLGLGLLITMSALTVTVLSGREVAASPELFISEEVAGTSQDSELEADQLVNQWEQAANCTDCILSGTPYVLPTVLEQEGQKVEVYLQNITNIDDKTDLGSANGTQVNATGAASAVMQDGAPKPARFIDDSYITEAAGSRTNRNALLFSFNDQVSSFGAWFGDLETRTDGNGTPAIVRLVGSDGLLISEQTVTPTVADQAQCGSPVEENFSGCGNQTTRFIGFHAALGEVAHMLVIVGDDDSQEGSNDASTEHLSAIGFSVIGAELPAPTPSPTPEPTSAAINLTDLAISLDHSSTDCSSDGSCQIELMLNAQNNSTLTANGLNFDVDLSEAFAYDQTTNILEASSTLVSGPVGITAAGPIINTESGLLLLSDATLEPEEQLVLALNITVSSPKGYASELISLHLQGYGQLGGTNFNAQQDEVEFSLTSPTPTTTPTPTPTEEPTAAPTPEPTPTAVPTPIPTEEPGGGVLGTNSSLVKTGSAVLLMVSVGLFGLTASGYLTNKK